MLEATVIGAFYNKVDYLKLVLAGFERQTLKNFEFIIADDGSSEDVVSEIKIISSRYTFPVKHIWQEDKGFRKNKILNKAILESESDYLIFIDCDCVPHRAFVEGHLSNSNKNTSLTGRRVNLSKKITDQLNEKKVREGFLEEKFVRLISDGLFGNSIDVEKGLYLRNKFLLELILTGKTGDCSVVIFLLSKKIYLKLMVSMNVMKLHPSVRIRIFNSD